MAHLQPLPVVLGVPQQGPLGLPVLLVVQGQLNGVVPHVVLVRLALVHLGHVAVDRVGVGLDPDAAHLAVDLELFRPHHHGVSSLGGHSAQAVVDSGEDAEWLVVTALLTIILD